MPSSEEDRKKRRRTSPSADRRQRSRKEDDEHRPQRKDKDSDRRRSPPARRNYDHQREIKREPDEDAAVERRQRDFDASRRRTDDEGRRDGGDRRGGFGGAFRNKRRPDDDQRNKDFKWGKTEMKKEAEEEKPKEKPNFSTTGKLAADTNTFKGVVIKYNEPPEARKPKVRWRLYPFKGDESLPTLYVHRQSAYLIGRDRKIADLPIDHPSSSKQHAALQYRCVPEEQADGSTMRVVKPYIIDLDSANGTFLNNKRIEPRRYYELIEKDVLKFGFSTREYVLLHEKSGDGSSGSDQSSSDDDDQLDTSAAATH